MQEPRFPGVILVKYLFKVRTIDVVKRENKDVLLTYCMIQKQKSFVGHLYRFLHLIVSIPEGPAAVLQHYK